METARMHMPHPDRDRRIADFIERYGRQVERSGGPAMAGRIVALLLVSEERVLSSSDIAEALQTSSGTVSTNTRLLQQLGWLERVRRPGQRGVYFRIRPHAIHRIFDDMVDKVTTMRGIIDYVAEALPAPQRDRIDEIRDFYAFLEEELPGVLARWHARHEVPVQEELG